jgi:hypothetical protein
MVATPARGVEAYLQRDNRLDALINHTLLQPPNNSEIRFAANLHPAPNSRTELYCTPVQERTEWIAGLLKRQQTHSPV